MREIKFRAWDKENKTMYDWNTIRDYPIDYTFGSDIIIPMQYTGLNDKNGQELYEGDICTDGGVTFTIGWNKFTAGFVARGEKTNVPLLYLHLDMYEKIGNIHDKEDTP